MNRQSKAFSLVLAGAVAALTAVGAYVRLPMWPVPITLQTLFVFLGGSLLPAGYALAAQLVYLACGLIGLPVFAAGAGLGVALQPTFGYLLAFPLASALVSMVVRQRGEGLGQLPSWRRLLLANSGAAMLVLALGVSYLYVNLNVVVGKRMSMATALWSGAVVFLPGEALKVAVVSLAVRKVWRTIHG
ncbi:MAG: biotin transporter BioY [Calditrichaeota bacterium]|nr:biotin transporter BioY [Calditrichota bacterium]